MKSKHLAKADFLRQLKEMTLALYELGDFTSENPERALLSKKIEGFIEAGLTIDIASQKEIQDKIDLCHLSKFGESRIDRRERLKESGDSAEKADFGTNDLARWEQYDSPAFDRTKPKLDLGKIEKKPKVSAKQNSN